MPSYVERQADRDLLSRVLEGEYCYVLTPRQMGKSSLMIRTEKRLREQGVRTVVIDLTGIGTVQADDLDTWYLGLLSRIREDLSLRIDPAAWWKKQDIPPPQRFVEFIRLVVEYHVSEKVVIFIDEIDSTLKIDFRDDFFAAIRSIYNERARTEALERVSFVLLGVASPIDLIKDKNRTPFNIGQEIVLNDFSPSDAGPLVNGLAGRFGAEAQRIFNRVHYWTDGHPYLTQNLCKELADSTRNSWPNKAIDDLVESKFLADSAEKDTNIQFVSDLILSSLERDRLLRLYKKIHQGNRIGDDRNSREQGRLKLSGLVEVKNGRLAVRNRIYHQIFDLKWVRDNQTTDIRLYVISAMAILMIVLVGLLIDETLIRPNQANAAFETLARSEDPAERAQAMQAIFCRWRTPGFGAAFDDRAIDAMSLNNSWQLQAGLYDPEHYGDNPDCLVKVINGMFVTLADIEDANSTWLLREMKRGLETFPDHQPARDLALQIDFWLHGRAALEGGNFERAVEYYSVALGAIQPNEATPWTAEGERWDWGETEPVFIRNPAILFERGQALTFLGSYEAALDDFEAILADSPLGDTSLPPPPGRTATPVPSNTPTFTPTSTPFSLPTATSTVSVPPVPVEEAPTATATPTMVVGADFCEDNSNIETACLIAADEILAGLNFVPLRGDGPDTDFYKMQVREGQIYECETLNLSLFSDTNLVLYDQNGDGIAGNDNRAPDDVSSLVTFEADYTGWLYLVVGSVVPVENEDAVRYTYDFGCRIFSPTATPTSVVATSTPRPTGTPRPLEIAFHRPSTRWSLVRNFILDQPALLQILSQFNQAIQQGQENRYPSLTSFVISAVADVSVLTPIPTQSPTVPAGPIPTRPAVTVFTGHEDSVSAVLFMADGQTLISASRDRTIRLWDLTASNPGRDPLVVTGSESEILSLALSSDNRKLASGMADGNIRLWDFNLEESGFDRPQGGVLSVAQAAPAPQSSPTILRGHEAEVLALAFAPESQLLASASADGTVRLWNISGFAPPEIAVLSGHTDSVRSIVFSPDGGTLASGGEDGTIRLWDMSDTTAEPLMIAIEETVRSVAFSPDGQTLAVGSEGARISLWDMSDPISTPVELIGHGDWVSSLAFAPDGQTLASGSAGSADQTIHLWDLRDPSADPLMLTGHVFWISSVAFSPDGQFLASSTDGESIRLWNLSLLAVTDVQDSDADRLSDEAEIDLGTDPNDPDSDDDGLSDWDEVQVFGTDPLDPDTDGDNLSDGDEVQLYMTNPLNEDTDGDTLPDGTEALELGILPTNPDTDGDGIQDNVDPFPGTSAAGSAADRSAAECQPSGEAVSGVQDAQFLADVTIPDEVLIERGADFTKTWRIRNTGETAWGDGYCLIFVGETLMSELASYPVPAVQPGEAADLSLPMKAPFTGETIVSTLWQLQDPQGNLFGEEFFARIQVPDSLLADVTAYSQRDVLWRNMRLGESGSPFNIEELGALLTTYSMLTGRFGVQLTPAQLNVNFVLNGAFEGPNLDLAALETLGIGAFYEGAFDFTEDEFLQERIDILLAEGIPVPIQVDFTPDTPLEPGDSHYVLLVAREEDDYIILDPWDNPPRERSLFDTYGSSSRETFSEIVLQAIIYVEGVAQSGD